MKHSWQRFSGKIECRQIIMLRYELLTRRICAALRLERNDRIPDLWVIKLFRSHLQRYRRLPYSSFNIELSTN